MKRLVILVSIASFIVPAMAQPRAKPASAPCLKRMDIYSYQTVPGNRAIIVTDLSRVRYRVNFTAPCYNLQYHIGRDLGLHFKIFGIGGLACVDRGDSIIWHDPVGPGQCFVRSVQYDTAAMDRADSNRGH